MADETRKQLAEKGLKIRREVLGAAHVDKALASANEFNRELQDLLAEFCWGGAWGRETLSRRDRSLMNLAMLAALGKSHEVAAHTRGALNNGMTPKEIAEVFLHVAVYAGVPAAVDAFRSATPVIDEHGK
jgi:4-carboxymuconolactone decarboxylase